jgi:hypothetical protein
MRQVFIPTGACWLNLQEAWWRVLRRQTLARQRCVDATDIEAAVRLGMARLNRHTKPWIWGRPPHLKRTYRRRLVYLL